MIKSKRGRKPKNKPITDISDISENLVQDLIVATTISDISNNLPKKRGRKPKGGKIIQNTILTEKFVHTMPNIIMHLQCTIEDVNNTFNNGDSYDPTVIQVENYDNNDDFFKSNFTLINDAVENSEDKKVIKNDAMQTFIQIEVETGTENVNTSSTKANDKVGINQNMIDDNEPNKINSKIISQKLKELSHKLHNNVCDNKSACFWCTCKFNTANIYIPKSIQDEHINVYGCFCSPECATSFLMNENIDSSIKFERYSLINYIYGAIYKYKHNIKPAPNPYYTLDKYCGNLTIEEYRQHFTDDNLLIVANKPQSRIFPELFEENSMSNNDMRYSINKYS